jgi:hypothetical protein
VDILKRDSYIEIIQEIRNTEKVSIDTYIDKRLIPLQKENTAFIKTLYKDIYYLLDGIDKPGDNDLMIKDGDFVIEQGDLKLTGYQTRLHDLMNWLHQQVVAEMMERNFQTFVEQMEDFENNFLKKPTYTPEYKVKLDSLKASIRDEREYNYEMKKKSKLKRLLHIDLLELKPNFCGLGINFNEMIKRIKNK